MNVGIILAAGLSERFKSTVHKQYLKLNGKEVIFYSIDAMKKAECFDKVIVVVDQDEYLEGYIGNKYSVECICGGDTRNKSIYNALEFVHSNYPDPEKIVFHDCSRPFIKSDDFKFCIKELDRYNGIAMSNDITDSLVTKDGIFVNRREFLLIQTPEAFKFDIIYNDFDINKNDTTIINQIKDKSKIYLYSNSSFNFKITYPQDLFLAEQLMRINYVHVSQVVDKTYKIDGKVLVLGGSGGVGQAVTAKLKQLNVTFYAPTHKELDLLRITPQEIADKCPFKPDIIINVAAAYENDETPLLDSFDKIFDVNLKSNIALVEYAKTLNKPVNIVVMSSSSSTRGRENLTNYSAAKAALNSFVESQSSALAKLQIYLNAVIPEKINTPLIGKLHKTEINTRELLGTEEVIDAVLHCATTKDYGKLIHLRKGL